MIQESIEGLRADINEKQLRVVLDLSAPEHHVCADPARLRQIFGNLFSNATKFTPPSGQITVRSYNVGGNLHIEVADTGLGITEGELPHIFDEFVQGDETSARFGGVGLGLSSRPSWFEHTMDAFGRKAQGATRAPHFILNFRFGRLLSRYPLL